MTPFISEVDAVEVTKAGVVMRALLISAISKAIMSLEKTTPRIKRYGMASITTNLWSVRMKKGAIGKSTKLSGMTSRIHAKSVNPLAATVQPRYTPKIAYFCLFFEHELFFHGSN